MKELKGKGMGNKKQKADPFTKDEINILYSKNFLGTSNPQALLSTVWLNNCLHFGMRSRQEHLDLMWGDIEMKATTTVEQYLEYNERETKTRKGRAGNTRKFAPKMFAVPDDPRCPIKTFKEFLRRRPDDSSKSDSRFYLAVIHNPDVHSTKWFINQPMGKNTLGYLVKKMADLGNLSGRKVNHSARKTTVTELLHGNIEATSIMQLTGHKNVASINDYGSASIEQQKSMSNILSGIGSGNPTKISSDNIVVDNVGTVSTSYFVEETFNEADDLHFANMDFHDITNAVEQIINVESNQNANNVNTMEAAVNIGQNRVPLSCQQPSKFSILPYATGSVTINIYGGSADGLFGKP